MTSQAETSARATLHAAANAAATVTGILRMGGPASSARRRQWAESRLPEALARAEEAAGELIAVLAGVGDVRDRLAFHWAVVDAAGSRSEQIAAWDGWLAELQDLHRIVRADH